MFRKLLILIMFVTILILPAIVFAEDINSRILDLRKQIEELNKKAEEYKKNVNLKQKEGDTLKRQIDLMNNQILRLQTQILSTSKEIDSAKLVISDLQGQVFEAQGRIEKHRGGIGRLLTAIAESDRVNLVAFLLKNPRLSDFTQQTQQVKEITDKLFDSISELKSDKEALEKNQKNIEQKKADMELLNNRQLNQKNGLGISKETKDKILVQTKGQEREYQRLLTEIERKETEFFNELKNLEADALKEGAFIVHLTATQIPPRGTKLFKWPEDDYYLTQGYGNTKYAKRGAYGGSPHNGIDLSGGYGTALHPVANGAILASGKNHGFGNWVAVRHAGDLVTVYAHMNAPSGLTNGTPVDTSSVIGYEGKTGNATGPHLHLSLYSDFFTYINAKNGQIYFNYFEGTLNPLDYLP